MRETEPCCCTEGRQPACRDCTFNDCYKCVQIVPTERVVLVVDYGQQPHGPDGTVLGAVARDLASLRDLHSLDTPGSPPIGAWVAIREDAEMVAAFFESKEST